MNSFEFNKIAASVLVALLVAMSGSLLSDILIHQKPLEKNVIEIDLGTTASSTGTEKKELQPITPLLVSADPEKGKIVAKKCLQCHTFDKGGANHTGPNLWGIIGNQFAHAAGFAYSQGFQDKHGKGTWDVEELNKFLYKPREYVPGTKMSFVGIADEKERADLIAYLMILSDNPQPTIAKS